MWVRIDGGLFEFQAQIKNLRPSPLSHCLFFHLSCLNDVNGSRAIELFIEYTPHLTTTTRITWFRADAQYSPQERNAWIRAVNIYERTGFVTFARSITLEKFVSNSWGVCCSSLNQYFSMRLSQRNLLPGVLIHSLELFIHVYLHSQPTEVSQWSNATTLPGPKGWSILFRFWWRAPSTT